MEEVSPRRNPPLATCVLAAVAMLVTIAVQPQPARAQTLVYDDHLGSFGAVNESAQCLPSAGVVL
jgi:hypothetical protein